MIKSIEVSGKNEEEAIRNALAQLGLTREEVSVEILDGQKPASRHQERACPDTGIL